MGCEPKNGWSVQAPLWPVLGQALGLLIVLVATGEMFVALVSRRRRLAYERARSQLTREIFSERLGVATARRIDRSREQATWNGLRKFRVAEKRDEGGDIASFLLEPHDGKPIPTFRPGQYLTLSLKVPGRNRPEVRCYSLSEAPGLDRYRITVKRLHDPAPGTVSTLLHVSVNEGDLIDLLAPAGDFYLDLSRVRPVVLVAGGVGLTPLLSILNTLAAEGFDREVWLFYGVREPGDAIMFEHLGELARQNPDRFHLHVCYSRCEESDLPREPGVESHAGTVTVERFETLLPSSDYDFYVCGPPPMMDSITHGLRDWGVPDDRVFFESFGPASVTSTPRAEEVAAGSDGRLVVTFARSGVEQAWNPAAGNLLQFALDQQIDIPSGCRAGNCGTCVTAIRSGEIDYLKPPGNPPDTGSCLACICVPDTNLVLDV